MSWKKLILVIIFFLDCARSKQQGSFKLQMKDGNFFFDDGNGDVSFEVVDKGPDISSIQDEAAKDKDTCINLDRTVNVSDDKQLFSSMQTIKQQEKLNELRRLLGESNFADVTHGEGRDSRVGSKENNIDIQSNVGSKPKGLSKMSKMSDSDMQKIRDALDKEYGNSILLIPRTDLEYFINFVKEYSLNDLQRNSDSAEFQNTEDRMRLRDHSSQAVMPHYQLNWSKAVSSKPQPINNVQLTPENRQLIVEEFSRFLDLLNGPRNNGKTQSINSNSAVKLSDGSNSQIPSIKSDIQNTNPNRQHPELTPLETVKDILVNLSDDKSVLKQSLIRLFDRTSETEPSQKSHSNFRRSLGKFSLNSSSLKKKKDKQRGNSLNATDKAPQFQRISREDKSKHYGTINLFPQPSRTFNPSKTISELSNKDWRDSELKPSSKQNQQSQFNDMRSEENFMTGERHTRADFIR